VAIHRTQFGRFRPSCFGSPQIQRDGPVRRWDCSSARHSRRTYGRAPTVRIVNAEDVAALAVDLMTNTAVTGATFDIQGGQQLVEG
jgi:hypothetical protein